MDAGDPFGNEPRILPRGKAASSAASCEKELAWLSLRQAQILVDRLARLVGQLETDRPAGFPLPDGGSIMRVPIRGDIIDTYRDDVAASQLAVDR